MTDHEVELALALGSCSFPPGSSQKRFARDLAYRATNAPTVDITLRQRHYLELLAWKYRRQLPKRLVPDRKPLDRPAKVKETKKRTRRTKAQVATDETKQERLL